MNTPRQLVSAQGQVTFSARYTPWGETLQSSGTGNFTYGYLGGVMDTSTGLLYVGNGQYYDPTTGRFLSRNAKPDQTNPYVPWGGNPTGALFAPLALLSLLYSRKKKRGTLDTIIILVVLGVVLGMSLTACQQPTPSSPAPGGGNPPAPPPSIGGPAGPTPTPNPTPQPGETPVSPTALPQCPTAKNWLPVKFLITHYVISEEDDPLFKVCNNCYPANIPMSATPGGPIGYHQYNNAFVYGRCDEIPCQSKNAYWGVYQEGTGYTHDHQYITKDSNQPANIGTTVFTYVSEPKSACGSYLETGKTIAVSQNNFSKNPSAKFGCGKQFYIEGLDGVFTITDSGTKVSNTQFDIYVGPIFKADFDAKYGNVTHTMHLVAPVQ